MTEHRAIEAAERAAAIMTAAGMPRMPARVMMALVAAPEQGYTAADLGDRLGVSAAAISGAVRYLAQLHFINRRTLPGERRERFFLVTQGLYRSVTQNRPVYERSADEMLNIAAELDEDGPARARAEEMASFFRFMAARMPQLIQEWQTERQAGSVSPSAAPTSS
jgi:DNA-binding transcriptional regulator GbsR (MarR family)